MEEIFTIIEVARLLKVSKRTVFRMIARGTLRGFKVGAMWRFHASAIEALRRAQ